MALIHCDFYSEVLGVVTSMNVILPQKMISQADSHKKEKYPVLYLLHGLTDNYTGWQRKSSIERYVSEMGLAVIMPDAGRSFYTDMKHGYKYFTFITEELPKIAKQFFPISDEREDTFVAGLSMGGYGAFKLALSCPEKYAAAASLSGALDMVYRIKSNEIEDTSEIENILGDLNSIENSKNDLFYLTKQVIASEGPKPKLYQCCGTEDFLYKDNQNFKSFIENSSLYYTYQEGPGAHEWIYWDAEIQKVLKWLPINK